ncbi:AAA family ATPase [bacterium]|nr:AAA family ATPase [bacterium]
MFVQRVIKKPVLNDLEQKMVLLAGPRQCGKTTLAKQILNEKKGSCYSWDIDRERRIIRDHKMDEASPLWIFDELHKYRMWRNWLKGVYDFHHERHSILVTGSAKLAVYSRGGDSLQ